MSSINLFISNYLMTVEIAKSPSFSSTFSVATAKGENEIINTQSFDIANQAFMVRHAN